MDAGEMPQEALARELREEVGLDAEVEPLPLEIYLLQNSGTVTGIVLAFRAVPAAGSPAPIPGDDVTDARWFPATALPADVAFDSTRHMLDAWAQGCMPSPAAPASSPR
jgi:8-oxo-dGTP pyrophosphatase MutT (NUDIX family)